MHFLWYIEGLTVYTTVSINAYHTQTSLLTMQYSVGQYHCQITSRELTVVISIQTWQRISQIMQENVKLLIR